MSCKCVWMVIGVRVSLRDSLRDSCVVDVPWVDDGVNGQQIQQSASESAGELEEGSYLYVGTCTSTRSRSPPRLFGHRAYFITNFPIIVSASPSRFISSRKLFTPVLLFNYL